MRAGTCTRAHARGHMHPGTCTRHMHAGTCAPTPAHAHTPRLNIQGARSHWQRSPFSCGLAPSLPHLHSPETTRHPHTQSHLNIRRPLLTPQLSRSRSPVHVFCHFRTCPPCSVTVVCHAQISCIPRVRSPTSSSYVCKRFIASHAFVGLQRNVLPAPPQSRPS
jgi:hypothetical protein